MSAFTCPHCSSHAFTSMSNGTRLCLGYKPSEHPLFLGVAEPCTFSWERVDDFMYGLMEPASAPDESGQFDVGAFVSDAL
jgi:hypothetical protein